MNFLLNSGSGSGFSIPQKWQGEFVPLWHKVLPPSDTRTGNRKFLPSFRCDKQIVTYLSAQTTIFRRTKYEQLFA
jgi:hypothetical protein